MTSLAKALEPSSRAASALGPKQATPRARTASATPATSGASGPITTRSAASRTARSATLGGSGHLERMARDLLGDPGVARCRLDRVTAGSASSVDDQGVLARAGPDDEDSHGARA